MQRLWPLLPQLQLNLKSKLRTVMRTPVSSQGLTLMNKPLANIIFWVAIFTLNYHVLPCHYSTLSHLLSIFLYFTYYVCLLTGICCICYWTKAFTGIGHFSYEVRTISTLDPKKIYGNWDNCKDVWKTGAFTIGSRREDGAVKLPVFRTYRSHDADVGKTETVFVGYTAPVFARYS